MIKVEEPELVDEPLDVQVVGNEIVLTCAPLGITTMTAQAALETGNRLAEAARRLKNG